MLCGADYVMTRNGDKRTGNLQVRLDISRTAHLFVLFDKRMTPPAWLSRDFIDTGEVVGLQHEGRTDNPAIYPYAIWKRTVPRGTYDLGMSSDQGPGSMYGIAAVAASDLEEDFPQQRQSIRNGEEH